MLQQDRERVGRGQQPVLTRTGAQLDTQRGAGAGQPRVAQGLLQPQGDVLQVLQQDRTGAGQQTLAVGAGTQQLETTGAGAQTGAGAHAGAQGALTTGALMTGVLQTGALTTGAQHAGALTTGALQCEVQGDGAQQVGAGAGQQLTRGAQHR